MTTRITPPADAPTPWKTGHTLPDIVFTADGHRIIARFDTPEFAAYAVAAANALPGLVQELRNIVDFKPDPLGIDPYTQIASYARRAATAALAALPKEVKP